MGEDSDEVVGGGAAVGNEVQRWMRAVISTFQSLDAGGPSGGDVPFAALCSAARLISQGFAYLYDEGHICTVLREDSNGRCQRVERAIAEKREWYGGSLHLATEKEIDARGLAGMKTGSPVNDGLWMLRIFRFVLRLFEHLSEPQFPVGRAGRLVSYAVTSPPETGLLPLTDAPCTCRSLWKSWRRTTDS